VRDSCTHQQDSCCGRKALSVFAKTVSTFQKTLTVFPRVQLIHQHIQLYLRGGSVTAKWNQLAHGPLARTLINKGLTHRKWNVKAYYQNTVVNGIKSHVFLSAICHLPSAFWPLTSAINIVCHSPVAVAFCTKDVLSQILWLFIICQHLSCQFKVINNSICQWISILYNNSGINTLSLYYCTCCFDGKPIWFRIFLKPS